MCPLPRHLSNFQFNWIWNIRFSPKFCKILQFCNKYFNNFEFSELKFQQYVDYVHYWFSERKYKKRYWADNSWCTNSSLLARQFMLFKVQRKKHELLQEKRNYNRTYSHTHIDMKTISFVSLYTTYTLNQLTRVDCVTFLTST